MPRFTKLFILGAIMLSGLCTAGSAFAESASQDNPLTNVFFRYGQDNNPKGLQGNAFSLLREIYKNNAWINDSGNKFGTLKIEHGFAYLTLVSNEHVVAGAVLYQVPHMDIQVNARWGGKKPLPMTYRIDGHVAKISYIDIGIHSNSLFDQTTTTTTTTVVTQTVPVSAPGPTIVVTNATSAVPG